MVGIGIVGSGTVDVAVGTGVLVGGTGVFVGGMGVWSAAWVCSLAGWLGGVRRWRWFRCVRWRRRHRRIRRRRWWLVPVCWSPSVEAAARVCPSAAVAACIVGGGGGVSVGGGGGGGVSVGNGSICAMLIGRDEADWAVTAARAGADERTGTSDTSVTRTTSNVRDRILGMGTAFAGAVTGQEGSPATASRIHGTASAVCGRRHLIPPCRAFSIANMSMGVCALSNATRRASWIGRYCLEC